MDMKSEKSRATRHEQEAAAVTQRQALTGKGNYLADNRSAAVAQRKLVAGMNEASSHKGIVQRKIDREDHLGGEIFLLEDKDMGGGSGTSEGTRTYVNKPGTYKPKEIHFDYAVADTKDNAKKEVTGNKFAWSAENPQADHPYKSGRYWDAGHKLGRQNGGLGNQNDWVFPQNPSINQGNHRNMDDQDDETHSAWRKHEDEFHDGVEKYGAGAWWVKLP